MVYIIQIIDKLRSAKLLPLIFGKLHQNKASVFKQVCHHFLMLIKKKVAKDLSEISQG